MSAVDRVLEAIASLSDAERRELLSRLGVSALPARTTQLPLLDEFRANSLSGPPDHVVVFDGGSEGNPGRGYGSYAIDGEVRRLAFDGVMTSNEAEYLTLLHALDDLADRIQRAARQPEDVSVEVRGDSSLVLNQVSGTWKAKDDRMRSLRDSVRRVLRRFKANRLTRQPRAASVRLLGH